MSRFAYGLIAILITSTAWAAPQYEVTNLTEEVMAAYSDVKSIDAILLNEFGQVGGTCTFDNYLTSAFLYDSNGQFHFLDAPGTSFPDSHGVITVSGFNDFGQVVGRSSDGAYLWDTNTNHYEILFPEITATLGGSSQVSWGDVHINNQGQMAGAGVFPAISSSISAFFWDPDDGFQVISKEGYSCYAERFNNAGGFTMSCYAKSTQDPNKCIATWNSEEGMVEIPWLQDAQTMMPIDIDNEGNVTICTWNEESSSVVLWSEENGFSDLIGVATSGTCATAVNDLGEMVGSIFTDGSGTQAIYWAAGSSQSVVLDTLVEYDYGIQYSNDINNAGLILAESTNVPGIIGRMTLLLTPVPEQKTFIMLLMLFGMLVISFATSRHKNSAS